MFVLQTGKVRISMSGQDGDKTLALLGPGEFFGEMAILNNKPRTATAEVVEDAQLLEIDAKTFEAMVLSNSEIAVRLIRKLAQRLDSADALIEILMNRDPKARVILGLAREAEFNSQDTDRGALVALNRKELAQQCGVAPEQVAGVLSRLSRLGIVEEHERGHVVPDLMRLHEFLEFLQTQEAH